MSLAPGVAHVTRELLGRSSLTGAFHTPQGIGLPEQMPRNTV